MWKSIGSAQSNQDRSIHSNRSRQDTRFEPFHKNKNQRSHMTPQANRSFCYEYFQKKRGDARNMTYNQRPKSQQKSQKPSLITNQNDMFTSMRNVLSKEEPALSKIQSKNMESNNQNLKVVNEKKQRLFKQAQTRVKNLKRDQAKLKTTLQKEFTALKNYLYHFQETINDKIQAKQQAEKATCEQQQQPQLAKQIMQQAVNIQKFFQEMDRKKGAIMQKLSRHE